MKKLLLSVLLSLGVLTIPFTNAEAATTKDQLIVNTQLNKMDYYQNGKFIKSFTVATGKAATPTPKGTFQIVNKIKNRPSTIKNVLRKKMERILQNKRIQINKTIKVKRIKIKLYHRGTCLISNLLL